MKYYDKMTSNTTRFLKLLHYAYISQFLSVFFMFQALTYNHFFHLFISDFDEYNYQTLIKCFNMIGSVSNQLSNLGFLWNFHKNSDDFAFYKSKFPEIPKRMIFDFELQIECNLEFPYNRKMRNIQKILTLAALLFGLVSSTVIISDNPVRTIPLGKDTYAIIFDEGKHQHSQSNKEISALAEAFGQSGRPTAPASTQTQAVYKTYSTVVAPTSSSSSSNPSSASVSQPNIVAPSSTTPSIVAPRPTSPPSIVSSNPAPPQYPTIISSNPSSTPTIVSPAPSSPPTIVSSNPSSFPTLISGTPSTLTSGIISFPTRSI